LPFRWDDLTVAAGLNFTLTTARGDLDLLGEVTGGGTYEQLLPFTAEVTAFGITCRVVTLERLIQLKRAAGRPKDLEVIAELQALLEERGTGQPPS
jgi:predicted nucleotidyltransferase